MSSRAWVTLATNDSYSLGALVVAHSLKRAGSVYPAVVLITPSVTDAMRDRLSAVFAEVIMVNVLDSEDAAHLALLQRPELGVTFTKIHCWNLTQYEKCVFLDADTLIVRNCDELFDREELSAAPDVGWPDCFNTGVFVFSPSKETFENLIKFAQERGSFDGGDQGLLNSFFSDWARGDINKHLPFLYNVTSAAFYSYLPALKHYGQDLKIIHFIGAAKPWLQRFNWESRSVDAPEHLREFLQLWWDLFVTQIHTQLDTSMSGVAGNLARVVPGTVDSQREAVDELTRRQGWEAGNIDYMGADSFDNILAKISQTLNQARSSPPKQPSPPKEQPKVLAADKVEVLAVDKAEVLAVDKAEDAAVLSSAIDKVDTPSPTEIPTTVESAPVVAAAPVIELETTTKPAPVAEEVPVVKAAPVTEAVSAVEPTLAIKAAPAVAAVPVVQAEATLVADPTAAIPLHAPPTKTPALEDIPISVEAALDSATSTKTSLKEQAASVSKTLPEPVKSAVTSDTIAAAPLSTDDLEKKTEKAQTPLIQTQSAPKPIVEAVSKVDVPTEAPKSVEKTPEKAKEALAPVAKPPLKVTPEKPTDVSSSSTDSPPLVNTPSKDEVLQQSSAKSEERRKPVGKLHLSPPTAADPLPTPDSESEDAASLAQSIIAGELRTPTVSSPSPSASPASPPAPIQEKRLSVEEPEVPTPPVASAGAVSLAQIGVKPSKGKSSTASLIETSLLEKSSDTAATPVASPPKTPSTPSSPSDASKKKAPESPAPSEPKTSVPSSPKSPSAPSTPTDAPKKKMEKKLKEGASSAEMPVPPPRKKEKKPKDK